MMPRGAEEAQNGTRSGPKPPQEEPKKVKKANPNGKTKKGPNQDDPRPTWTSQGGESPLFPSPPGAHFGGQIGTKTEPKSIPKRSKIEVKNQESKKTIQDDLGPVLGRSWAVLGAILGPWKRSGTTPADVS